MNTAFVIFLSILLAAFFAGMEIAFLSSNKLRLELDRKQGLFSSRIIAIFRAHEGQYIVTIQLWNNIAVVIFGLVMARTLDPAFAYFGLSETGIMLFQTLLSTLIILIFAEFLPKTLFRMNPNQALNWFSLPLFVFYAVIYPLSSTIHWISNLILKNILRVDSVAQYDTMVFGKVDLEHLINEKRNKQGDTYPETQDEIRLFQNALDFSSVRVRDCMIPRTEIMALDMNDQVDDLRQKFIHTGFSKILIYDSNTDNMVGYVTSKSLFSNPDSIRSAMIDLFFVPETMTANRLLKKFIQTHKSVAVVVDEFGGISGMVTIEDLIEEIFGEIDDEHDVDEFIEKQPEPGQFLFSGRLELDYLNENYGLKLPESENYDTLAGYIIYYHQRIPKINDKIIIGRFEFRIMKVSRTRIDLVQMKIIGD